MQSLLYGHFFGTTFLGAVSVGAVSVFGSLEAQVAMLGTWLSILAGLVVTQIQNTDRSNLASKNLLAAAGLIPGLSHRPDILQDYLKITQSLSTLSNQTDPVLVEFAKKKLDFIADQVQAMANGEITFASTEVWRMTYEQLLRSKNVHTYRSVAWFKSHDYWQDEPGKKGLQLNLELKTKGLKIHRLVIVRDELWLASDSVPTKSVMDWIDLQHQQGIDISLVKESELLNEPELCRDMGIYDDRAVGIQELDDHCRTLAFTLYFGRAEIQRALANWQSLLLYARQYETLLGK